MLDVCLLGSGGMMPASLPVLSCLMTRFNGSSPADRLRRRDTGLPIKEKAGVLSRLTSFVLHIITATIFSGLPGTASHDGKCRPEGTPYSDWP